MLIDSFSLYIFLPRSPSSFHFLVCSVLHSSTHQCMCVYARLCKFIILLHAALLFQEANTMCIIMKEWAQIRLFNDWVLRGSIYVNFVTVLKICCFSFSLHHSFANVLLFHLSNNPLAIFLVCLNRTWGVHEFKFIFFSLHSMWLYLSMINK